MVETRQFSRLARDTLALILAGGRGSRLQDLTQWLAKPAVHFGSNFVEVLPAFQRTTGNRYPETPWVN